MVSVYDSKKPKGKDNHIGLEIELLSPFTREQAADLLQKDPFKSHIQIKGDSSIYSDLDDEEENYYDCSSCQHSCNNHVIDAGVVKCHYCNEEIAKIKVKEGINSEATQAHELNFIFKEKDLLTSIQHIKRILMKLKAYTNKSCGLHVHIDMRNRNATHCFAELVKAQPLLFKLVKKSRRRNSYCSRTPKDATINNVNRHSAINGQAYREHTTIEVRLHHGTTDTAEILWWIKTLLTVVEKKKHTVGLTKWIKKQTETMKKAA